MSHCLSLAVLVSGNGSNLQAIIDAIENNQLNAEIKVVVSNKADAYGLVRAKKHQIKTMVLSHRDFPRRQDYDDQLLSYLRVLELDFIVLAGFMRILGADFVQAFASKILNIHPSLLPTYKGLHTHQRALDNNESEHGVSIHLVTAELDDGPVLIQARFSIDPTDSAADLQRKGHQLEHKMYPQLLQWLSEKKLTIEAKQILNGNHPIKQPLVFEI